MRFRFVHAADLHLDTPFTGIARTDERVAQALQDASLDAWDALVDLTLAEQAAFLLLAGDLYDGPRRGLRAQLRFANGVQRLCRAGVRVFAVHGNHDPLGSGWSAVARWPDAMAFFPADRVSSLPVERDGKRLATVHGISFAAPAERRNLARLFAPGGAAVRDAPARLDARARLGLQVGVLHCNVGGNPEHGNYAPCAAADLAAAGLDYWALGHVHRRTVVLGGDPCWAIYPGNLQGRSPAPGESGAKGAMVVECDDVYGIVAPPRFVPLDRARFVWLDVDAAGAADASEVVERIGDAIDRLREQPEDAGKGLVVRATARCDEGGRWLAQLASGTELLDQVRGRAAALTPFVWCDAVRVRTRATVSREAVTGRGDFAADLVARCDELRAYPAALEAMLARIDADLPVAVRAEVASIRNGAGADRTDARRAGTDDPADGTAPLAGDADAEADGTPPLPAATDAPPDGTRPLPAATDAPSDGTPLMPAATDAPADGTPLTPAATDAPPDGTPLMPAATDAPSASDATEVSPVLADLLAEAEQTCLRLLLGYEAGTPPP